MNAYDVYLVRNGSVGDTITIFPTCIVSAEQFYARLGEHYHSFNNFHVKLNAEFEANKLKRYSRIPGICSLQSLFIIIIHPRICACILGARTPSLSVFVFGYYVRYSLLVTVCRIEHSQ